MTLGSLRHRRIAVTLFAPAVLALAACGGVADTPADSSSGAVPASSAAQDAFPVTVTGANGPVTLDRAPEQIVSLSPSLTENLFAIGAGPQVEAVDDNSNYPADAPTTKLSGFQPNAEAVAGYSPDLVVLTTDSNGVADSLTKLEIPTLVLPAPATLDEAYQQMETLGHATGHADDAAKLVGTTKERIEKAVTEAGATATGKKVYHELDQTFYSLTSSTFLGSVYAEFGLTNIADAAAGAADSGGYPQLSAEYVVKAAPDLIVLADTKCCQQTPETLAKRPGFAEVPAVKNGAVVAMDDDIASRWGPRIADFAESVAAALQQG